jgi:hypothetical protein
LANIRISQYTSIGRPLGFRAAIDRAVLLVSLASAVSGAALAWSSGDAPAQALWQAMVWLLVVFGSWALAREFNPDDPPAAFIGMAAGLVTAFGVASPGILLAFTTLALMRIVNRSSGLAARKSDSIGVTVLAIVVMYTTRSPFFGVVAALAFILDGSLREPLRHQWLFALVCAGATIVYMVDHDVGLAWFRVPGTLLEWLSLLFVLILALNALLLREVRSRGDFTGRELDLARVRGAIAVGLAAVLQGLNRPAQVAIVVAAIAGISMGMALRKGFRVRVPG